MSSQYHELLVAEIWSKHRALPRSNIARRRFQFRLSLLITNPQWRPRASLRRPKYRQSIAMLLLRRDRELYLWVLWVIKAEVDRHPD